jgi:hemolysin activation/secretion protein
LSGAAQDGASYNMARLYYLADLSFENVKFRSEFNGQYTPRQVFWTEGMFIGGTPGGRGFPFRMVYSDSGFLFKNDLTFPIFQNSDYKFLRGFAPGIIADYTAIFSNGPFWFSTRRLVYAGPSISYTYDMFNFTGHYVRTIDREEWNPE